MWEKNKTIKFTAYFIDKDSESIHKESLTCASIRAAKLLSEVRQKELNADGLWRFQVLGITEVLACTSIRR